MATPEETKTPLWVYILAAICAIVFIATLAAVQYSPEARDFFNQH